ncbi:MAG: hypothetical protein R6X02_20035 [Enhygromyxa sp.]
MRRLALVCCTCLACTRPNPAFDEAAHFGESHADAVGHSSDDSSDDSSGDSSDDSATSDTGLDDLPDQPTCLHQPRSGLAIEFGDSSDFGNTCPTSVDIWAKVGTGAEGEVTLVVCTSGGCGQGCTSEQTLSAFPLIVSDHLPELGSCV